MVYIETLGAFYKFILAIALGALIGVEREKSHQLHKGTDFAGIRTFMLITFLGCVAAYLASLYYDWLLAVIFVCFVLVVMAGYIFSSYFNKDIGMTTELSTIIAFIIGVLVFSTSEEIPTLFAIALTLILSFKTYLHQFVYNLKSNEFFDTMKFMVIAFVILPLLKQIKPFGPFDAINLYEIWLMVVFVSGLSFIGYILIRLFGSSKGTILTGMMGGILSSTAVVSTLAAKSKESQKDSGSLVIAAAIACSTMFLRVLIEVAILNINIIEKLAFPLVLLSIAGFLGVSIMWKKSSHTDTELNFSSPLMLKPAFKFGFFYAFVLVFSNISHVFFGEKGVLFAALMTGVGDADAIAIFVARHPDIGMGIGITAIILAAVVNTITKVVIAKMFGSKEYGNNFLKVLMPAIITGLLLIILL